MGLISCFLSRNTKGSIRGAHKDLYQKTLRLKAHTVTKVEAADDCMRLYTDQSNVALGILGGLSNSPWTSLVGAAKRTLRGYWHSCSKHCRIESCSYSTHESPPHERAVTSRYPVPTGGSIRYCPVGQCWECAERRSFEVHNARRRLRDRRNSAPKAAQLEIYRAGRRVRV
jgi:hypothetical protein